MKSARHITSPPLLRIAGRLLLAGALAAMLFLPGAAHAALRTFAERYTINTTGDIHIVGNTAMTCSTTGARNPGACANARAGIGSGDLLNNNSYEMIYVDVDGLGSTSQSSTAALAMPAGSTVRWAGLYWGGESNSALRTRVSFRTPAAATYSTIFASVLDTRTGVGCADTCDRYSAFADVTNLVAAAGNGTYYVGNVQSYPNAGTTNASTYGGWALVVVFENPALPLRNLSVFDGYVEVGGSSGNNISINVFGFLTPYSGPVNTTLGVVAGEGDLGSTGDNFILRSTSLADPTRPLNNFFNCSISDLGSHVTSKNPNYRNQLGWDIGRVNASNILANGSTSATITLNTGGEWYYPSTVTFATDLYMPIVTPNVVKTGVDVNGGNLVPGDILRYTISMTNTGYDTAQNLILTDPIPAYTTYVPGSLQIVSGANAGSKSDAAGDDQAEYLAAGTPQVVFRLGTGADAVNGGALAYGEATALQFDVRLDNTIPAGTILTNSANLSYNGQTLGTVYTAASSAAASAVFVPPTATKSFVPNPVATGGISTMTIQLTNPAANLGAVTNVAFNDVYPAGMVNANPASPTISCTPGSTPGTLSGGVAGGNSIGMAGATIAQNGSCTVTVRVTSPAQGNYLNSLGPVTTGNAGTGTGGSATFSVGQPTIAKSFGAASIVAGTATTTTFVLTNPTTSALTGAAFTDPLPAGLVVASGATANSCGGTLTAAVGTGTISLAGGTIPATGSCTITVPVTSSSAGIYDNTTSGVSTAQVGTGAPSNTARLLVYSPVTAAKSFAPASISANGAAQLSITVSNPNPAGLAPVTGVAFTDTYPAGLINTTTPNPVLTCTAGSSGTLTGGAAGGNTLGLSGGVLASGGSCTLTVNVTSPSTGNRVNSTGAISTANAGTGAAASATLNVSALTPPGTTKSFAPATVARNQASTLTVTLSNSNGTAITGAAFTDSYPTGLVNTATPNPATTCSGGTVTAAAGGSSLALSGATIPANGSCSVTVAVASSTGDTYYNNTGLVTTANAGVGLGGAGTLTVLSPTQVGKVFTPNPVAPGATSQLTITFTNPPENGVALTGVALTDTYPAGLVNTATPNPATTCSGATVTAAANGNALTISGATIPVNSSCTATVNVRAAAAGNYVNTTGNVTSTIAGAGGTASSTLQVGAPGVSKAFSVSPIVVGDSSRLTVTLTNPTTAAMTAAAFTDSYPAGMTNTAAPAAATTCGGTVTATAGGTALTLSGGTIPANGSCTVSVNVTATATVTNTIPAGAVTVAGGAVNGTPASAELAVTPPPQAAKSFAPASIPTGGTAVLTITVSNPTSSTVTGVAFTDSYPAGLVNTASAAPTLTCTAGSSGTYTGGASGGASIGLSGGTLAGNGSCTLTVNVTSATPGSYLNATGAITSSNGGTGSAAEATLTVLAPFTAVKSFAPATISAGDTSVLTVTLTNPNAATAVTGVDFTDSYPAGLTNDVNPLPASTCGGTVTAVAGGNSLTLSGGTIPAGGSCTVSAVITSTAGDKTNPAFIVTSTNDGTATAAAALLDLVTYTAPLVTKTFAADQTTVGTATDLTILLVNPNSGSGNRRITGVVFTDDLPLSADGGQMRVAAGAQSNSCGGTLTAIPGTPTVSLSDGIIQENSSCQIVVPVAADGPGTFVNTIAAVASTNAATGGPATDTLVVVLPPPTVTKSFTPGTVAANSPALMTITIANPSDSALTGVNFTDSYPAGLVNTAAPGVANSCGGTVTADPGGTVLVLNGGTVPANGSCSVSVNVTAAAAGSYLNNTGPVYSGNAQNAAAAEATLSTTLALPSLTVVKSADKGAANPGEAVVYTITLTNSGPGAATNVVLDDRLGRFAALRMDTFGAGQPFSFSDGATPSGYAGVGSVVYSQDNGADDYTYVPQATGVDPNVTNWRMTMPGPMNGNGASFTLQYVQTVR